MRNHKFQSLLKDINRNKKNNRKEIRNQIIKKKQNTYLSASEITHDSNLQDSNSNVF